MKPFYPDMDTFYDEANRSVWLYMRARPVPCFTPSLLRSLSDFFHFIQQENRSEKGGKYRYLIGASGIQGVYNLGGNLELFYQAIRRQDRETLMDYAVSCIDVLYAMTTHLQCPELTTITLVCGDALGGGMEAALAGNVLIAEKGSRMGLPEVVFNLFPGMGAYSLLSRKVGAKTAEQMILSGRIYTAEELYEMGIVDILAEPGGGVAAVNRYIGQAEKNRKTHDAMCAVTDRFAALPYQELLDITTLWVDSALKLDEKDLQTIQILIRKQKAKWQAGRT